jgi:hypothetical protein
MHADLIIVTTDGDHTSAEVIVGLIHILEGYTSLNNSVMDTIITCPEAVICRCGGDLNLSRLLIWEHPRLDIRMSG